MCKKGIKCLLKYSCRHKTIVLYLEAYIVCISTVIPSVEHRRLKTN